MLSAGARVPRVQQLALDAVIVVDPLGHGVERAARAEVQPDNAALCLRIQEGDQGVLLVKAAVDREHLGYDQQRVRKRLHAHLGLALDRVLVPHQVRVAPELERAGAGYHRPVLDGVFHGAQAVAHRVVDLVDGVLVGALDEDSAREWVADVFHKRVLFLAQHIFIHQARMAQHRRRELVQRVDRRLTHGHTPLLVHAGEQGCARVCICIPLAHTHTHTHRERVTMPLSLKDGGGRRLPRHTRAAGAPCCGAWRGAGRQCPRAPACPARADRSQTG
jgi:hypothetical protein